MSIHPAHTVNYAEQSRRMFANRNVGIVLMEVLNGNLPRVLVMADLRLPQTTFF